MIEKLIEFRNAIDGDADLEDDNQDCCAAHDDCIEVQCFDGPAAGWNLGPGDPDDAEEDDPTEDNHDAEQPQYPEPRRDPPSITMPHPSR